MDYYTIPTKIGAAKLTNAALLGQKLEITQVVFGDSGGEEYEPSGDETALVNQTYSTPPNDISPVDGNDVYIQIQAIVPSNVGGWYLREIGCYDADGDLIFIGNIPPTYKPSGDQSVVKDLDFKVVYNATAADNVIIKIDNTAVIATRDYADRMDASMLEKAKAYADTQDDNLKAYVDAQDKAGQTAAKSDATTKANQALADSKKYADEIRAGIFSLLVNADESSGYLKLNIDDDTTLIIQSVALETGSNGIGDVRLPISFTKTVLGGMAIENFAAGWLGVSPEAGVIWGFDSQNSTLSSARVQTRWVTNNSVYASSASGRLIIWGF